MPESTLAEKLQGLESEVGFFLGYGRGANYNDQVWTTTQQADINSCLRSGQRQFLYPPTINGEQYEWSFMRPTATFVLDQNESTLRLPDDFGGFEGRLSVQSGTTPIVTWPIPLVGEGIIREKYAICPTTTGRPLLAAMRPLKTMTRERGQRFELYVWPISDQQYTFECTYYLLADAIDASHPFMYGGAQHAETIQASCLAAAELKLDDATGVRHANFMDRLMTSIAIDRRLKPQLVGYNGDRSDNRGLAGRRRMGGGWWHGWSEPATYNGQTY